MSASGFRVAVCALCAHKHRFDAQMATQHARHFATGCVEGDWANVNAGDRSRAQLRGGNHSHAVVGCDAGETGEFHLLHELAVNENVDSHNCRIDSILLQYKNININEEKKKETKNLLFLQFDHQRCIRL